jgi:hypothetical protein
MRNTPSATRRSVLLAVLLIAALASPVATGTAYAKMIAPGTDTFSIMCWGLQSRVGPLVEEYGRASTTAARMEEILTELRQIGQTWISAGCRDVFGQITMTLPKPKLINKAPASGAVQSN